VINVSQGMGFYKEFIYRLNELTGRITDFLLARDLEKNEIMKSITSGQFNNRK